MHYKLRTLNGHQWLVRYHGSGNHVVCRADAIPDLVSALKDMLQSFETGEHYETRNPYCRPYVKAAIAAIDKAEGSANN